MDLAEIWRVIRTRWYVMLPGVLLTATLLTAIALLVPLKFQSQSTVELLNSQKGTVAFDGNPFLSTQLSLTGMADSLARNLNSDASIAELRTLGVTKSYHAKIADNAQAPLMWLTVTGTDRADVLQADQVLTAYAARRLGQIQEEQSVAPEAMIRMVVIVPPQPPTAQAKTRIEYLVAAGLLGITLSLVATFFVEARRRPRDTGGETEPLNHEPAARPLPEPPEVRSGSSWFTRESESLGEEATHGPGARHGR